MVHCNRLLQDGASIPPASPQNQPLLWCYRAAQALVHTDQRYKRLKRYLWLRPTRRISARGFAIPSVDASRRRHSTSECGDSNGALSMVCRKQTWNKERGVTAYDRMLGASFLALRPRRVCTGMRRSTMPTPYWPAFSRCSQGQQQVMNTIQCRWYSRPNICDIEARIHIVLEPVFA